VHGCIANWGQPVSEAGRWLQVRELFEDLVDADSSVVQQRLADVRRVDPGLASEVASLLEHDSRAGRFLARPPVLLDDEEPLQPGAQFGAYRIEAEAGRGGMGRVYVARDTRLDRRVCLKTVRPDLIALPGSRERLRREARLAASVSHPGVCAVYALEEIDGVTALVTEYVDGPTLRHEIATTRPAAEALAADARDLAAALAAAHACGVTHSDLKPENIMRSADGRLKVLDFGVARAEREQPGESLPDVLAGTLTYMAPEQINGAPADARSDVFSLATVLYECAAGTHPFAAGTALAVTARILEHDPVPLGHLRPDLAPGVASAIDRCLRKRPATALLAALNGGDLAAAPSRRTLRWWRVHQIAVIVLYLVACVVAWAMKQWYGTAAMRWLFVAAGLLAAIMGIVRGHLVFTARAHADRLQHERIRARRWLVIGDLAIAALLLLDGVAAADAQPVAAVLTMALAAAIAAAALVIGPATSAAAFGE
jgi:hypothetical protein